jgi:AraC-like DNA-binding protein
MNNSGPAWSGPDVITNVIYPKMEAELIDEHITEASDTLTILKIQDLVNQHFKSQRSPEFYSDLMRMELHQLNGLLKSCMNKTLTSLIQDRLHTEAERLLVNSRLSCKQISFYLKVSDPPYFSRCFKKRTGMTPLQFRERYRR